MRENIYDEHNNLIGWTIELPTLIQIFDRTGRMLGYYVKLSDKTLTTHGFFGRGNQLLRLLE